MQENENKNETSLDTNRLLESSMWFLEKSEIQSFLNDLEWDNIDADTEIIEWNSWIILTDVEKEILTEAVNIYKKTIISMWIKNPEMKEFYKRFHISKDEIGVFINYFWWERILSYLIRYLKEEAVSKEKFSFISTKFLDFIKRKNLWIEDLLKIIVILKNCTLEIFLDEDIKILNQINIIFDEISINLSKNYNDITIKLLNEYNNAINNSNVITKTNIFGYITYANDEFCKLSWYSKEELIGKPHNIVRHPDMSKEIFADLWSTIQNKKIWKWIIKNKKKDGWSYWAKSTIVPILDENNQIVEYVSIRTDITELKEIQKNLEEYTSAMNDANMILKTDSKWVIISINKNFLQMVWYAEDVVVWKVYLPDFSNDSCSIKWVCNIPIIAKEEVLEIKKTLLQQNTWKWIIKNKWRWWNFFWTSASIVPIVDLNDEVIEYVVILTDVTDLEIAQQKIKISYNKLKELDLKKDEFLNIASHELRTPITSIKWYISMILDWDAWDIWEEVKLYLSQVYRSSDRLLGLVNDMLDISKIESWREEFNNEDVNIVALIKETADEVKHLFKSKNQIIEINIDFENFVYNTDANKLKQILLNLLWNANKFTPDSWKILIKSFQNDYLYIQVIDSWIGIKQEDFGKIFEKFWQVKNSLTRDISWTGLGLPIVKAIVEKMWWFIEVQSEPNKWSTFTIKLPKK